MSEMSFEEIRRRMKQEVRKEGGMARPKGIYSTNRLNALSDRAAKQFGQKAARELHKEMLR